MTKDRSTLFPAIRVEGSAYERGVGHGEQARELIAEGLDRWFARLSRIGGGQTSPEQTVAEFVNSTDHLSAAERWTPLVVEEMRGIAAGANVPFETIWAYNLPDEQEVFLGNLVDKCSTVGIRHGLTGAPISGQTLDTPGWFEETKLLISSSENETGIEVLSFAMAGVVAFCGANSAGLSVWCNAVYQLGSSRAGVPVACIARTVLSQPAVDAACQLVTEVPHASGQNYLIGSPHGVISLECSATSVVEARREGDAVWHTNHPLENLDRIAADVSADSLARDDFLSREVPSAATVRDLQAILADRTTPVCKVREEDTRGWSHTLWAVLVEHTVPPKVYASAGPPARLPWRQVPFGAERIMNLSAVEA